MLETEKTRQTGCVKEYESFGRPGLSIRIFWPILAGPIRMLACPMMMLRIGSMETEHQRRMENGATRVYQKMTIQNFKVVCARGVTWKRFCVDKLQRRDSIPSIKSGLAGQESTV